VFRSWKVTERCENPPVYSESLSNVGIGGVVTRVCLKTPHFFKFLWDEERYVKANYFWITHPFHSLKVCTFMDMKLLHSDLDS
jgi:hypothetical protein